MAKNQKFTDSEKRSNVESFGYHDPRDFEPAGRTHSGQGHLGESIITFIITFVIFAFGIYSLGMYPDGGWIWWCVALAAMVLPWAIVWHLLSSKTNRGQRSTSTELTQL